jgi:hypothetical protein
MAKEEIKKGDRFCEVCGDDSGPLVVTSKFRVCDSCCNHAIMTTVDLAVWAQAEKLRDRK